MAVRLKWFVLGTALCVWLAVPTPARAVARVFAVEVQRDVNDLSANGLSIGKSGFWFANFNAKKPVTGVPPDAHHVNRLPAWVLVDFDPPSDPEPPPYSFSLTPGDEGPDALSTGGQPGYAVLTLPDGARGLSGQLVDTGVGERHMNTLIKSWEFGPGAPTSALMHVVLDNAPPSAGTAVDQLRITHVNAEGGIKDRASFDDLTAMNNGVPDVYTFRLEGMEVGGSIALQLHTAGDGSGVDAGLAGIAFDAIEFPPRPHRTASMWPVFVALSVVAALTVAIVAARRIRGPRPTAPGA